MKKTIGAFIIFTALTATYSAHSERIKVGVNEIHLLSSRVGDTLSNYILNKNNLSSLPSWDGTGEPPLSNSDVTALVLSKHKQLNGNIESKVRKVSLSSKETHCNTEQKCPETLWYYKVKVKGEKRATYIVLINGEFVEPM